MKRRSLTIDKIIAAGLAYADQHGFDALSMRKLAAELNVTAMSLYNHVSDKDDLLDLMLNEVVTHIESPVVGAPWEEMMRRRAYSMREVLLRHHWAPTLLISRITLGEAILKDIDTTVGCLVHCGFTHPQADWARNAIDSHVYGYTIQELNFPVDPEDYRAAATEYLPMISKEAYPYMYAGALEVIEGRYDGRTDFSFGLELILTGLARWLENGGTGPQGSLGS